MRVISHRGNLLGIQKKTENNPDQVDKVLSMGFDCEIDVWYKNNNWYLGHDKPIYKINEIFLENKKLWCHAKNLNALSLMLKNRNIHCFWHQKDDFTITSKGYIWTYPNKNTTDNSVIVLKNKKSKLPKNLFGICTDFVLLYKNT
jgi:hypothetical protein